MAATMSAEQFVEKLVAYRSPAEAEKYRRYFKTGVGEYGDGDVFMGVRMGQIFALAKEFIGRPLSDIETCSKVRSTKSGLVRKV